MPPFYRNLRKELVKMPKVYFHDNFPLPGLNPSTKHFSGSYYKRFPNLSFKCSNPRYFSHPTMCIFTYTHTAFIVFILTSNVRFYEFLSSLLQIIKELNRLSNSLYVVLQCFTFFGTHIEFY